MNLFNYWAYIRLDLKRITSCTIWAKNTNVLYIFVCPSVNLGETNQLINFFLVGTSLHFHLPFQIVSNSIAYLNLLLFRMTSWLADCFYDTHIYKYVGAGWIGQLYVAHTRTKDNGSFFHCSEISSVLSLSFLPYWTVRLLKFPWNCNFVVTVITVIKKVYQSLPRTKGYLRWMPKIVPIEVIYNIAENYV